MRQEIALLRADRLGPGSFALFLDEADALQRTDGRTETPLLLEQRIRDLLGGALDPATGAWRLSEGGSRFRPPQLLVAISATLLPVFMKMHRTQQVRFGRAERRRFQYGY